jgi:hypothetical protein
VDGSIVLRVDPPFSGDGGDGRPGYGSIGIPEYGGEIHLLPMCFGAIFRCLIYVIKN